MVLGSPAFAHGESIPSKHTGDGLDVSPALSWSEVPADTRELALIVDDPDAPRPEPWVHWVVYKLESAAGKLGEGVVKTSSPPSPKGALQGLNSWGRVGYGGPAPPRGHGTHHYHFRLYALDTHLTLLPGIDKSALLDAMKGHIIAEAELIGTYSR